MKRTILLVLAVVFAISTFAQNKPVKIYDINGNIEQIQNYDSDGKKTKIEFFHQNGNTKQIQYYDSYGKKARTEFFYQEGSKIKYYDSDGKVVKKEFFYQNGNIKQKFDYINGNINNYSLKSYYINGNLHSEGSIMLKERNGKWIFYYKSGEKEVVENYSNGMLIKWKKYYLNGSTKRIDIYDLKNGKISKQIIYNPDGSCKENYFKNGVYKKTVYSDKEGRYIHTKN